MAEVVVFYLFALLLLFFSVMVITQKNPVTSAVFLVFDLFTLAGIYVLLGAEFVAAIQVIVYAGAILILFIFVIMLLNLDPETLRQGIRRPPLEWLGLLLFLCGVGIFILRGLFSTTLDATGTLARPFDADNTQLLAETLFTSYLWPFELASMLILLAVVASVVIAKKKQLDP